MRLIYVLALLSVLVMGVLWSGWYGLIKRKVAVLTSAAGIGIGGVLLLMAVLPTYGFYGPTATHNELAGKTVALTFDDGPYPTYTNEILSILQRNNVKATFFMVGESALLYPEVVAEVAAQGHEVALHAFRHRDFLKLTTTEQQEDVAAGKAILEQISGQQIRLMRPPHGFRDWSVIDTLQKNGLRAVNWSVIPRDWTNPGTDIIVDRVLKQTQPGAIILLHDGDSPKYKASRQQTVQAVQLLIDKLRVQNYAFVTVSELLEKGKEK